jgi:protein ImuB
MDLIHMQLEQLALPGPVTQIQLSVLLTARMTARQQKLFDDAQKQDRQLALLVDRLSSRIGRRSVTRPILVPEAQPEFAYRCHPLTGRKSPLSPPPAKKAKKKLIKTIREDPKPSPPRPLLVESRPIPLSVIAVAPHGAPQQLELHGRAQRVVRCWGPERIQTGWWRNKYIRRDYYGVQTDDGRAYWVFRSGSKWFLQGEF